MFHNRAPAATPEKAGKRESAAATESFFYMPDDSIFKCKHPMDLVARCCFVGIFIVENVFHFLYFDVEMEQLVAPALRPLPRQVGVGLHVMHIVLGILGAVFVILSGFAVGLEGR